MLQVSPTAAAAVTAEPMLCGRGNCRTAIGWVFEASFWRAGTMDSIDAPATLHIRCKCGFINHVHLTLAGERP